MRIRRFRSAVVGCGAVALVGMIAGCPAEPAAPASVAQPGESDIGPSYLRRLTGEQLDRTVRDLLGSGIRPSSVLPPDEVVGAFYSNTTAPVTSSMVQSFMLLAEDLATEAVTDLERLLPCDPSTLGEDVCAGAFVDDFGLRAYRRPLSEGERGVLWSLYETGRDRAGFSAGIRLVVVGALQSPYFIYHAEFGADSEAGDGAVVPLTPYELAARLSYFLWGSMPDNTLLDAAGSGGLESSEQLREHAVRLLLDPRARDAIASFHLQWLGLADIDNLEKDADAYPGFTPELRAAMKAETSAFADYVVRYTDGTVNTLLTAPFGFPSGELFPLYGVEEPAGYNGRTPVALDPDERAGLLTQASVLAVHAHPTQSSPIRRGVLLRQNLLCLPLPEPPPDVDNTPPEPDPNATTRERFAQHRADPKCAACHALIDPLGVGLEHYDGMGVYRTEENGLAIDAIGDIVSTNDLDGTFDGAVELARKMAESEQVRRCLATQWFRFALGRVDTAEDEAGIERLYEAFAAADFNIRALLVELVTTNAFRYRRAVTEIAGEESTP